jgi:hypothetical protein
VPPSPRLRREPVATGARADGGAAPGIISSGRRSAATVEEDDSV